MAGLIPLGNSKYDRTNSKAGAAKNRLLAVRIFFIAQASSRYEVVMSQYHMVTLRHGDNLRCCKLVGFGFALRFHAIAQC